MQTFRIHLTVDLRATNGTLYFAVTDGWAGLYLISEERSVYDRTRQSSLRPRCSLKPKACTAVGRESSIPDLDGRECLRWSEACC